MKLPWVENDSIPTLNKDFELCKTRLNSLIFRLKKDTDLLKEYNGVFEQQLKSGIIEVIPESELMNEEAHVIPHHPVIKRDRDTAKCRVVFDGAAKSPGEIHSLNDHLQEGPQCDTTIVRCVVKVSPKPIALTSDIQSAFLQIRIDPADRDKLRFLWYTNLNTDSP